MLWLQLHFADVCSLNYTQSTALFNPLDCTDDGGTMVPGGRGSMAAVMVLVRG